MIAASSLIWVPKCREIEDRFRNSSWGWRKNNDRYVCTSPDVAELMTIFGHDVAHDRFVSLASNIAKWRPCIAVIIVTTLIFGPKMSRKWWPLLSSSLRCCENNDHIRTPRLVFENFVDVSKLTAVWRLILKLPYSPFFTSISGGRENNDHFHISSRVQRK